MKHVHEFSAFWSHYGPYGPQDVHLHYCINRSCSWVVIGPGRKCDGDHNTHHEERLS